MYISVRLFKGYAEPLLYQIPDTWEKKPLVGDIVRVPLRAQEFPAIVGQTFETKPAVPYPIKSALGFERFPEDPHYASFVKTISRYYQVDSLHLVRRMFSFMKEPHKDVTINSEQPSCVTTHQVKHVSLTQEQQTVCDWLIPAISEQRYEPTLLHGVTGSGKTEVYIRLINHTYQENKTTLLLLPEVTLALQFEHLLRTRLSSEISVYSFHCASSVKTKKKLWQDLLEKKPILIIGVHMPAMLPLANLGLIIVDEEHEVGFQEKKHPKINTKEAALLRAHHAKIPILLGSATPSITSLYNVEKRGWHLFELKNRFSGAFPTIKTVMLKEKAERRHFWITKELELAIADRLRKKEQIIIFINRRGFCFFMQCKSCSYVFTCINCSVSLTPHKDSLLYCHYCDYSITSPTTCSACHVPEKALLKKGVGTQQIVSILEQLFPYARIARADLETTSKKKQWHQTVEDFTQGNLDILVGTQTITKGYHFPNVTLVGIVWADLNLNFPLYNASETTLQQLIQVAGRAGRQRPESLVIVQTMTKHPIFDYLNETAYRSFYQEELENRSMCGYPPLNRLALIELKNNNEAHLEDEARYIAQLMKRYAHEHNFEVTILGPTQPLVSKIMHIHMRQIYLKSSQLAELITLFEQINKKAFTSRVYFTPNPVA